MVEDREPDAAVEACEVNDSPDGLSLVVEVLLALDELSSDFNAVADIEGVAVLLGRGFVVKKLDLWREIAGRDSRSSTIFCWRMISSSVTLRALRSLDVIRVQS